MTCVSAGPCTKWASYITLSYGCDSVGTGVMGGRDTVPRIAAALQLQLQMHFDQYT